MIAAVHFWSGTPRGAEGQQIAFASAEEVGCTVEKQPWSLQEVAPF